MTEEKNGVKKIRDLARKLGFSNSTVVNILRSEGFEVKSANSTLTRDMEKAVEHRLNDLKKLEMEKLKRKKEIWGDSSSKDSTEKTGPDRAATKKRPHVKKVLVKHKKKKKAEVKEVEEEKVVFLPEIAITASELAKMLKVEPVEIVEKALMLGVPVTINQRLDKDVLQLIAEEFGFKVEKEKKVVQKEGAQAIELDEIKPPVVTVMGHVDHGKTTLLDYIRSTKVAQQEVGAITQSIGSYQVVKNGKTITFIDTPGHEAFSAMRARGTQVTDIVVLVVAATEGVKSQTVEAINHAKAAGVPIVVAINKMDLQGADAEKVQRELSELGLIPEEWGGDTIMVPVSAKTGKGVEELLEAILLVAETKELKTTSRGKARGIVLESKLSRSRGPVATVIITSGTLKLRDAIVVGDTFGKVRAIINDKGKVIKSAGPSMPVEILGLNVVPSAGDMLIVVDNEKQARATALKRKNIKKTQVQSGETFYILEKLEERIKQGKITKLSVIVKADSQGSLEAVIDSLSSLKVGEIEPLIAHSGVGMITESDIDLATASELVVLGFNTSPTPRAKQLAKERGITIRTYKIIYKLLEDVEVMLKGLLKPVYEEESFGTAEVKEIFRISKVGNIAGCIVTQGKLVKGAKVRIKRADEVLHTGKIVSLKRFQDEVDTVKEGMECGVKIEGFEKLKQGDVLHCFNMVEKFKI